MDEKERPPQFANQLDESDKCDVELVVTESNMPGNCFVEGTAESENGTFKNSVPEDSAADRTRERITSIVHSAPESALARSQVVILKDMDALLDAVRESFLGSGNSRIDSERRRRLSAKPESWFGGEGAGVIGVIMFVMLVVAFAIFATVTHHSGHDYSRVAQILVVLVPMITLVAAPALSTLGNFFENSGRLWLAETCFFLPARVLRFSHVHTLKDLHKSVDSILIEFYVRSGQLHKADTAIKRRISHLAQTDPDPLIKFALFSSNRASVAARMGEKSKALELAQQALDCLEKGAALNEMDKSLAAAEFHNNLGTTFLHCGMFPESLAHFAQCLVDAKCSASDTDAILSTIFGIGQIYLSIGDREHARACFQMLLDIATSFGESGNHMSLMLRTKIIALKLAEDNLADAATFLSQGQHFADKFKGSFFTAEFLRTRADFESRSGKILEAEKSLQCALNIYRNQISMRSPIFIETLRQYRLVVDKLSQTDPASADLARQNCRELFELNHHPDASEAAENFSDLNKSSEFNGAESVNQAAIAGNRGSTKGNQFDLISKKYRIPKRAWLFFTALAIYSVGMPVLGGFRAADTLDWFVLQFMGVLTLIPIALFVVPTVKHHLFKRKVSNLNRCPTHVSFKRVGTSGLSNVQIFSASLGAPFASEVLVKDEFTIIQRDLYTFGKQISCEVVTDNDVPVAIATEYGVMKLADAKESVTDITNMYDVIGGMTAFAIIVVAIGTFLGSISSFGEVHKTSCHAVVPPGWTAYEYYRYGVRLSSAANDRTQPIRLKTARASLEKSMALDADGQIGALARKYAQSHLLEYVPSKSVLTKFSEAEKLIDKDENAAASDLLDECIKEAPQFLWAYTAKADLLIQQKDFKRAKEALEKAKALNEKDSRYLVSLARYYAATGNTDEVLALAKQVFANDPLDPKTSAEMLLFSK